MICHVMDEDEAATDSSSGTGVFDCCCCWWCVCFLAFLALLRPLLVSRTDTQHQHSDTLTASPSLDLILIHSFTPSLCHSFAHIPLTLLPQGRSLLLLAQAATFLPLLPQPHLAVLVLVGCCRRARVEQLVWEVAAAVAAMLLSR